MKHFNFEHDTARVVPVLRTLGTHGVWPNAWQRKLTMVAAVIAAHIALAYLAFATMSVTPPEALTMAETEVILEQMPLSEAAAKPELQELQDEKQSKAVDQLPAPLQRIVREADMSETVKPKVNTLPVAKTSNSATTPTAAVPQTAESKPADAAKKQTSEAPSEPQPSTAQVKSAGVAFNPKPPYPKDLEQAGIGGTVGLKISVNAEGRASAVAVIRSSGHSTLDNSARETVQNRWKFKPARSASGEAVASTLNQAIVFKPKS